MDEYEVTIYYRYVDRQTVMANSEAEAFDIACRNAEEVYDCCLDSEVIKLNKE